LAVNSDKLGVFLNRKRVMPIFAVAAIMAGCASSGPPTLETAPQMQAFLLQKVPVGTPATDALTRLSALGFDNEPEVRYSGRDFVQTRRRDHNGDPFVCRQWDVIMNFKDGVVTSIEVHTGLTGL
jgi:hypothetical protein